MCHTWTSSWQSLQSLSLFTLSCPSTTVCSAYSLHGPAKLQTVQHCFGQNGTLCQINQHGTLWYVWSILKLSEVCWWKCCSLTFFVLGKANRVFDMAVHCSVSGPCIYIVEEVPVQGIHQAFSRDRGHLNCTWFVIVDTLRDWRRPPHRFHTISSAFILCKCVQCVPYYAHHYCALSLFQATWQVLPLFPGLSTLQDVFKHQPVKNRKVVKHCEAL